LKLLALVIPLIKRLQHLLRASKRILGIAVTRSRHSKHRENLVADIFLDGALAGDNL
jgi:hypothetical protein